MEIEWRETDNGKGSKALFSTFKVADIEEASLKANQAVKIIKSHRDDVHSHMALSHEGLTIMLHGTSREEIGDEEWSIANEIRMTLSN